MRPSYACSLVPGPRTKRLVLRARQSEIGPRVAARRASLDFLGRHDFSAIDYADTERRRTRALALIWERGAAHVEAAPP